MYFNKSIVVQQIERLRNYKQKFQSYQIKQLKQQLLETENNFRVQLSDAISERDRLLNEMSINHKNELTKVEQKISAEKNSLLQELSVQFAQCLHEKKILKIENKKLNAELRMAQKGLQDLVKMFKKERASMQKKKIQIQELQKQLEMYKNQPQIINQ